MMSISSSLQLRQMTSNIMIINRSFQIINKRFKSSKSDFELPGKMSKPIKPGHARPAMYYKFDVMVQLSDGSVIRRKSQYPKSEVKSLQDQRNTPLWNPARKDLAVVDVGSGKVDKFKERYSAAGASQAASGSEVSQSGSESKTQVEESTTKESSAPTAEDDGFDMSDVDDYLDLLGTSESTGEVQKGGKVAVKKKGDDKKKKK